MLCHEEHEKRTKGTKKRKRWRSQKKTMILNNEWIWIIEKTESGWVKAIS